MFSSPDPGIFVIPMFPNMLSLNKRVKTANVMYALTCSAYQYYTIDPIKLKEKKQE